MTHIQEEYDQVMAEYPHFDRYPCRELHIWYGTSAIRNMKRDYIRHIDFDYNASSVTDCIKVNKLLENEL